MQVLSNYTSIKRTFNEKISRINYEMPEYLSYMEGVLSFYNILQIAVQ